MHVIRRHDFTGGPSTQVSYPKNIAVREEAQLKTEILLASIQQDPVISGRVQLMKGVQTRCVYWVFMKLRA